MSYSAIRTDEGMAVPSSRKRKTANNKYEETLPFTDESENVFE